MIVPSLLDTDHYKITMDQVIFFHFPRAVVRYRFFNRNRTPFPDRFADRLRAEIDALAGLRFQADEIAWLRTVRYLKPTFIDWLANYRFDPREIRIEQQDGDLRIEIVGPWYRTVLWEVPVLSLVSELFFTGKAPDANWRERIRHKAEKMADAGAHWVDFGTRRRFSFEVQDAVNEVMRNSRPFFLGTSNPYFAKKHGLTPIGTYAHESVMAMQALVGVRGCNRAWMDVWASEYRGDLGIALTDTVTSKYFFAHFGRAESKLFDGVRQDSGDPATIADMAIRHYQNLGIDAKTKRIVFSDSLNDDKFIALHRQFSNRIMVTGGIGTFLTNDVGHKPLNIVIKLVEADFGDGMIPVVKLSDDAGKYTGEPERIQAALAELAMP